MCVVVVPLTLMSSSSDGSPGGMSIILTVRVVVIQSLMCVINVGVSSVNFVRERSHDQEEEEAEEI